MHVNVLGFLVANEENTAQQVGEQLSRFPLGAEYIYVNTVGPYFVLRAAHVCRTATRFHAAVRQRSIA